MRDRGFTLIELSVVLIVIGLIVGGILVGNDLVQAAAARAQLAQITQFNQAANNFKQKYGSIPGDMDAVTANNFGFAARGIYAGQGDGNGIIEGVISNSAGKNFGDKQSAGESVMFWSDLTYANGMNINMIPGSFSLASSTTQPSVATIEDTWLDAYFPRAQVQSGFYIYIISRALSSTESSGHNYFQLARLSRVTVSACVGCPTSTASLPVIQAYRMDSKIDDGLPQSGKTLAIRHISWVGGDNGPNDTSTASPPSSTTCYDDGGNTGTVRQYSITQNNGKGTNCALLFEFQ